MELIIATVLIATIVLIASGFLLLSLKNTNLSVPMPDHVQTKGFMAQNHTDAETIRLVSELKEAAICYYEETSGADLASTVLAENKYSKIILETGKELSNLERFGSS